MCWQSVEWAGTGGGGVLWAGGSCRHCAIYLAHCIVHSRLAVFGVSKLLQGGVLRSTSLLARLLLLYFQDSKVAAGEDAAELKQVPLFGRRVVVGVSEPPRPPHHGFG